MTQGHPMGAVFNPRSIAIVGASEVPGKAAERRTRSLLEGGFDGEIYLINPKRDTLFGRKAYPSLDKIDGNIDLAMIVIPGRFIPDAVAQAAEKGAKGAVIITAGLGETGPEGKAIEAEILKNASQGGVNIIGPNCSGMFSAAAKMNLLGIPGIKGGKLSVLAQSGNIIDSLSHFARIRGRGFSRIISSGNAIGVRFHEYIDFLAQDPDTDAIMLYLESIKFGDEMVKVCRRATRKKPIVALKVGRTTAGQRASASHTGALAANDAIVEAAFKQAGIHRVNNVDEMFDLAEAFLDSPVPKGRRVAILSEGGGDNSVAADNAERWGLEVPVLPEERQARIKEHLLAGMPAHNPIDYGGTAEEDPPVISHCVEEVMADESVDSVYITGFFGGFKDIIAAHVADAEAETSKKLSELVKQTGKPLVMHTSFAAEDYDSIKALKEGGIPTTLSSDRAAQILSCLSSQAANAKRPDEPRFAQAPAGARDKALALFEQAKAKERKSLLEPEAYELLSAYGFDMPRAVMVRNPEEAAQAADGLEGPLACKIVSPDILHKSDCGGVELNLKGADQVGGAAKAIMERAVKVTSPDRVDGLLLTPMARPGVECIAGLIRDPNFGPVVMFGLGGIYVEVLKDVSFGVAPLTDEDIERMVSGIKGFPLLQGVRGQAPSDVPAIMGLIRSLSALAMENPEITEIDLNPILVHEKGLSVVDARVILL